MSVRILGVVMARNEWPGLGIAVTHALTHVDTVLVIDHASTDRTAAGLRQLQAVVGGRLHVMRLGTVPFWQEAITNLAVTWMHTQCADEPFDWVYTFDADEFLLVGSHHTLRDVLRAVPDDGVAVRYEVHNFVVPHDFDSNDPQQYERIVHRAAPCDVLGAPSMINADEIEHGNLNYFDLHFRSKVIVRTGTWICAGAHHAWAERLTVEQLVPPTTMHVAHLPFVGRTGLLEKVAHGHRLREQAFPPDHGWQSQMLSRIADDGRLDEFWAAHSMGGRCDADTTTVPTTVVDTTFADAVRIAAAGIDARPDDDHSDSDEPPPVIEDVPFDVAIASLRAADAALGTARHLLEQLDDDLALALEDRDALRSRRDSLQLEVNWLRNQLDLGGESHRLLERHYDELVDELTAANAYRAQLEVELRDAHEQLVALDALDALNEHRDALERELDAMRMSKVWRWSKPLRSLRSRLRR